MVEDVLVPAVQAALNGKATVLILVVVEDVLVLLSQLMISTTLR